MLISMLVLKHGNALDLISKSFLFDVKGFNGDCNLFIRLCIKLHRTCKCNLSNLECCACSSYEALFVSIFIENVYRQKLLAPNIFYLQNEVLFHGLLYTEYEIFL